MAEAYSTGQGLLCSGHLDLDYYAFQWLVLISMAHMLCRAFDVAMTTRHYLGPKGCLCATQQEIERSLRPEEPA